MRRFAAVAIACTLGASLFLAAAVPAAVAPAPQGLSSQLLGEYAAQVVATGTTVTARELLDTSSVSTISGLFVTSGTGTFAVNLIWKDTAGNIVATVSDVTAAVGDGVGFRAAVRAPRVLVQFEETGATNPVTVTFGVLLGQTYIGP